MDTGLVYHAVCPFTPQLSLVLIAPTHGGMARLSWPGWLVTYRDGLPVRRRSPIQVQNVNDVEVTKALAISQTATCYPRKDQINAWELLFQFLYGSRFLPASEHWRNNAENYSAIKQEKTPAGVLTHPLAIVQRTDVNKSVARWQHTYQTGGHQTGHCHASSFLLHPAPAPAPARFQDVKSGQVRLRSDFENWNPIHP